MQGGIPVKLFSSRALRIELALLIGLFFSAVASAAAAQQTLADGLIRLHITAPSDSEGDQALKLAVRDRILADFFADAVPADAAEAYAYLESALQAIEASAKDELALHSRSDVSASVSLERELFPERAYPAFALPAGEYTALRVTLGSGEGKNWWCVMFPPLCSSLASEADITAISGLDGETVRLITSDAADVKFKFKLLEWLSALRVHLRHR